MCDLVLSLFTGVANCQLDVSVQDIKDVLAYAIHDSLLQFDIMALRIFSSAVLST